jgi:hypothetical protein
LVVVPRLADSKKFTGEEPKKVMKYNQINLGQIEAIINKLGGEEGVKGLLSGALVVVSNTATKAKEKLLELVNSVRAKGAKKFVAKESFKKGNSDGVAIYDIYQSFKTNFLGKVEEDIPDTDLKAHKLLRDSRDPNIIVDLGDNHETHLAHIWSLMKLQPNGGEGALLTNGYANIFYVRDVEGVLWAVDVRWFDDGWHVSAYSVGYPDAWVADHRVFSR